MRLTALLVFLLSFAEAGAQLDYTVAIWNILCETCNPGSPQLPWAERKEAIIEHIKNENPDILGLQEVTDGPQNEYLHTELPKYTSCETPPDNQENRNVLLVKSGLNAVCQDPIPLTDNRHCAHALVKEVHYYNCHFPLTEELNSESANLFVANVVEPFVFMGDFNATQHVHAYTHNLLSVYIQTLIELQNPEESYNIDRIGASVEGHIVPFRLTMLDELSDHPYVQAKFVNKGQLFVIIAYTLGVI